MATTTEEQVAQYVGAVIEDARSEALTGLLREKSWYVVNRAANDETEVRIYDEIGGFGITAENFISEIEQIETPRIRLRINTPGGEVFDATAIYNALAAHPSEIIVDVDGVAASSGSWIAMSGDEIRMADNAYMMIHNARGGVMGEAEDMRRYADVLEKMNDNIADMYKKKAGKSRKHWRDLMSAETWFTAEEAKKEGLADTVFAAEQQAAPATASFDFKIYNQAKIPDPVKKMWGLPQTKNETPEVSPRGDPVPAITKEIPIMANPVESAPAPAPAVASVPEAKPIDVAESRQQEILRLNKTTLEATMEQGRLKGVIDGRKQELERAKAIVEMCGDNHRAAVNAILSGQPLDSVKLAIDATLAEQARAKAEAEEKDREIARWQALAATGGYPNGVNLGLDESEESDEGPLTQDEAKIRAEQEWDRKPSVRKGFTSKQNYVNFRKAELQGRFQMVNARD